MAGEFRQKHTFLRCRITAANNKDFFPCEEFPVAGGAVSNAPAFVFFLPLESNGSGMGAGSQQNAKTAVVPLIGAYRLDIPRQVKTGHLC